MASRECAQCGLPFVGQRSTAKYCSATCRARASKTKTRVEAQSAAESTSTGGRRRRPLVTVTRRVLREAGVLDTVAGQRAVLLAERASNPAETGSAVAALSKQVQEAVDMALGSVRVDDAMDEVTRRRDEKLAAARGA